MDNPFEDDSNHHDDQADRELEEMDIDSAITGINESEQGDDQTETEAPEGESKKSRKPAKRAKKRDAIEILQKQVQALREQLGKTSGTMASRSGSDTQGRNSNFILFLEKEEDMIYDPLQEIRNLSKCRSSVLTKSRESFLKIVPNILIDAF